ICLARFVAFFPIPDPLRETPVSPILRTPALRPRTWLRLEELESREVPASFSILNVLGTNTATFTDANANVVTVQISGAAGKAALPDSLLGIIDDGDNIAGVAITGASADFTMSFSVNGAATVGNVELGNITSTTLIRGIYTIQDNTPPVTFDLGSFKGPG